MPYKFERHELLKLLMRAYEEGNCGFLDLSEAVAEKLIEENEDKHFGIHQAKPKYPNVFYSQPELTDNGVPPQSFDNLTISNSYQGGDIGGP